MTPEDRDAQDDARSEHAAEMRSIAADEARGSAERDLHGYVSDAYLYARRTSDEIANMHREVKGCADVAHDLDHPVASHLRHVDELLEPLAALVMVIRDMLHDADESTHAHSYLDRPAS